MQQRGELPQLISLIQTSQCLMTVNHVVVKCFFHYLHCVVPRVGSEYKYSYIYTDWYSASNLRSRGSENHEKR